jgi:hypothetical protein
MIHTCEGCGLVHDTVTPQESAEVAIARINADSALEIAKLQASADRSIAKTEAEAAVEVASQESDAMQAVYADEEADEHVTDAINAVAAGLDPVADEPAEEPAPPVVMLNDNESHDEETIQPHEEEHETRKKSRGLGMW